MPAPLCFFRFVSAEEAEWLRPDGEVQRGALADLSSQGDGARKSYDFTVGGVGAQVYLRGRLAVSGGELRIGSEGKYIPRKPGNL